MLGAGPEAGADVAPLQHGPEGISAVGVCLLPHILEDRGTDVFVSEIRHPPIGRRIIREEPRGWLDASADKLLNGPDLLGRNVWRMR